MSLDFDLEEQSFINLVLFNKDELLRIHNGERASKVFTARNTRNRLNRLGVLRISYKGNSPCSILTRKALKVIEDDVQ